jgi:hypothetical protein
MTEPTVQVPASLIEALLGESEPSRRVEARRQARALLSQPTPTAEPIDAVSASCVDGAAPEQQRETAEPPRIEDMAPGTTFTEEVRWTVTGTLSTGSTVAHSGSGEMRFADRFDPSTIRDVTPPKDAP